MANNYVWGELYQGALLETDDKKLASCLHLAKAAIDDRLQEMHLNHTSTPEELHAIADALHWLGLLRTELERRT